MRLVNNANNNVDAKLPKVEDSTEDRLAVNGSNLIVHHHAQAGSNRNKTFLFVLFF